MDLVWLVYLVSRLDPINVFLTGFLAFGSFGLLLMIFFTIVNSTEIGEWNKKAVSLGKKLSFVLAFFLLILGIFKLIIPSEKVAYTMVAAYAGQKIYESAEAKQVGNKLISIINNKLDELDKGK